LQFFPGRWLPVELLGVTLPCGFFLQFGNFLFDILAVPSCSLGASHASHLPSSRFPAPSSSVPNADCTSSSLGLLSDSASTFLRFLAALSGKNVRLPSSCNALLMYSCKHLFSISIILSLLLLSF
jgi:hypothetical protein